MKLTPIVSSHVLMQNEVFYTSLDAIYHIHLLLEGNIQVKN